MASTAKTKTPNLVVRTNHA
ncbi:hypothetical protein CCACVL1_14671 [Corchorus capsularis]|uniref:Uncharacterized protein n=1 Tax=Corchorus capsularis TaxID=210143 RepID=A0A1R3I670_COCAP|nr:hypothetical protein CCACVL1_14671 [Corchorus capsularis]